MKKWLIALAVLLALAALLLLPNSGAGSYNITTGAVRCTSREACLHEAAHKADAERGWVSRSKAWHLAVDIYREEMWQCEDCRDGMAYLITFFPGIGSPYQKCERLLDLCHWQEGWGGYSELYAAVFQYAGGEQERVPEGLRKFYDFQRINSLAGVLGKYAR